MTAYIYVLNVDLYRTAKTCVSISLAKLMSRPILLDLTCKEPLKILYLHTAADKSMDCLFSCFLFVMHIIT